VFVLWFSAATIARQARKAHAQTAAQAAAKAAAEAAAKAAAEAAAEAAARVPVQTAARQTDARPTAETKGVRAYLCISFSLYLCMYIHRSVYLFTYVYNVRQSERAREREREKYTYIQRHLMQFVNSADLFVCLSVALLCVGSDSRSRNKESGGSHEADRRDKRCVSRAASIISVSIYTCASTHAYMHFGNGSRRLCVCHSAVCEQQQPQPQGPWGQQARRARSRRYQQQGLNPPRDHPTLSQDSNGNVYNLRCI